MSKLGERAARAAGAAVLAAVANGCAAASAHEQDVGAQVEQLCDARSLAAVGGFLQARNFVEPTAGRAPDASAVVAASACRAAPAWHARLVAAAYLSGQGDELLLVIAALDTTSGRVTTAFRGNLDSDPAVKIVSGSLWLDTAAIELAPGVHAFGLDLTSGAPRGCAGAGSGARRSLFVAQGRFIRPVLQDLPMSEWGLIQRGRSECTDSSAPDASITENFSAALAPATTATRGWRDLVVTATAARDDGHLDERPPFRAVLKWNGHAYPLDEAHQAWAAWRQ
jgi:hypothetical protein